MRPIVITKALTAASAVVVAASQTPVSGTALTLVGSATVTLDSQRRILATYGNELSARTLTLTGTNQAGAAITEILTIPSGGSGTVASTQDFLTVSQAMPGGSGWTAAMTLGTNGVGSSPWFYMDDHLDPIEVAGNLEFITGTATATVEITDDSPLAPLYIYQAGFSQTLPVPVPLPWPGLTNVSALSWSTITHNAAAIRLTVTVGTGTVRLNLRQAGVTVS